MRAITIVAVVAGCALACRPFVIVLPVTSTPGADLGGLGALADGSILEDTRATADLPADGGADPLVDGSDDFTAGAAPDLTPGDARTYDGGGPIAPVRIMEVRFCWGGVPPGGFELCGRELLTFRDDGTYTTDIGDGRYTAGPGGTPIHLDADANPTTYDGAINIDGCYYGTMNTNVDMGLRGEWRGCWW